MNAAVWWLEINVANNRRTKIRADKVVEFREDYVTEGKGKERRPIVRIIMEGGANLVAEDETAQDLWDRLQEALQRPFYICWAPSRDSEAETPDDV
jgi:hypothetical protein